MQDLFHDKDNCLYLFGFYSENSLDWKACKATWLSVCHISRVLDERVHMLPMPLLNSQYSTSAVDKAMIPWFILFQDTRLPPKYPKVKYLFEGDLAISAYVKPILRHVQILSCINSSLGSFNENHIFPIAVTWSLLKKTDQAHNKGNIWSHDSELVQLDIWIHKCKNRSAVCHFSILQYT